MPVIFSARCLERLLLLLLLLCISAWGSSPTDPAMTTQDSSQTEANSVTKMQTGHETSGPDATTEELASKQDTHSVSEHVIVLSDVSRAPVEKNVPLLSPTKVELTCKLDAKSNLKNPQMTWKKGSETISHTSKAQSCWTIQLTITNSSQLGTYICILKAQKEVSAVFHLQVPQIEGKEKPKKPIIAYEGDRAVMVCETQYDPKAWTWYIANGTELAAIDKILDADKFQIKRQSGNVNRLEVFKLTKEDHDVYWCEAAFELGNSKARFEVRVLSIFEPLKPFLAIVAEVVILVTTIFLYEVYSKRRGKGGEKELDQTEQLKSKDNVTVQRKLFKAEN